MSASIFNGSAVKILKNILSFKDGTQLSSEKALKTFWHDVTTTSGTASLALYKTYIVNTSGGAATLTLPAPVTGGFVVIKDNGNANVNNITINRNASETIDGATSYVLQSAYGSLVFVSDGTNWYIS